MLEVKAGYPGSKIALRIALNAQCVGGEAEQQIRNSIAGKRIRELKLPTTVHVDRRVQRKVPQLRAELR